MLKIAFIGAGGVIFTKSLVFDILLNPALRDSKILLMDIHAGRLANSEVIIRKAYEKLGLKPNFEVTTDLSKAVEGANYVFTLFRVGTLEEQRIEYEVPAKYGVRQVVGDTLNPGGIFRGLRVLPSLLEVAKKMEQLCPDAYLMNYVNPMSINTWVLNKASSIKTLGFCHSVQATASQIASFVGCKADDLDYWAAGVNHQSFFLKLERDGVDMYPALRKAMQSPEIYKKEKVRFEMLRHFDHFVTEGSGHNSEYNQYFRKRPDLLDKYCSSDFQDGEDGSPFHRMAAGEPAAALKVCEYLQKTASAKIEGLLSGKKLDVVPSAEYGIQVLSAIETDTIMRANLNVMNAGLIENLPQGCCVEVPCLVDGSGVHPCRVGRLPGQLAALNMGMINVQTLAVEGFLERDRRKIFHAVCADPLASAVCSLDELQSMTDELFEKLTYALPKEFAE
ncbi:MAG: hypothetical protein A2X49_13220 [Lentisphaerae bacterium GWF2_52_8]|nr:MAG: hypothetical protein A2X49_13220 [Lentisphaerae bacterium GWF2_52_8]